LNERYGLVKARQVDNRRPKILGAKISLAMIALVVLCASVMAEEDSAESWYNKGQKLDMNGSYKEAIKAYDKALEIDSTNGNIWKDKGYSLGSLATFDKNLSEFNESLRAFDKAIELIPANDTRNLALAWEGKAISLNNMGNVLGDMGNQEDAKGKREQAVDAYDKAIELDPSFTGLEAQLYRAGVIFDLGMYNESVAAYDKLIEAMPADDTQYTSMVWADKGSVLEKMGRKEEALKAFDKAIELNPTNAIAWAGKGSALESLGRNSEADTAFARAKELGITNLE